MTRRRRFDPHQSGQVRRKKNAAFALMGDVIMKKAVARAATRQVSSEAYVGLWSMALWALAAAYLFATFGIH